MKKTVVAALLGVALLGAGFGFWQVQARATALQALPVNTRLGGELVLPSTLGHPVDLKSYRGKVVLLTFGFTSCPDVCPTVMARLRQVLKGLGPEADRVQVLFVSFDPARDSLDHLKQYVGYFDPRMVGATGSEAEVAAVAKRYGVIYIKEDTGSAAGYGFAHSDYIYLIDAEGNVRKLYDTHASTSEIQADVATLGGSRQLYGFGG